MPALAEKPETTIPGPQPEQKPSTYPPAFMDEWEIEINEAIWRQQADGWFDDGLSRK